MRQRTVNALRAVAALTNAKCGTCKAEGHKKTRCCDKVFCDVVAAGLERAGMPAIAPTGHPTIPFMGEKGCVVPPELRPGCSGYVCREHLSDRTFRRRWAKLHNRFAGDPDVKAMMRFEVRDLAGETT